MLKNNFLKIIILSILISILAINLYSISYKPDTLTQHKTDFFKINGQSNFIGQLNLWYFFASRNDWQNAAKFEPNLNQTEVFKRNNQSDKLKQRISELQSKKGKDAQDYLKLAKFQSAIGLNTQASESIKQAHQIDPIRSDLDRLFYSIIDL